MRRRLTPSAVTLYAVAVAAVVCFSFWLKVNG